MDKKTRKEAAAALRECADCEALTFEALTDTLADAEEAIANALGEARRLRRKIKRVRSTEARRHGLTEADNRLAGYIDRLERVDQAIDRVLQPAQEFEAWVPMVADQLGVDIEGG